jgi:uncharacterized protein (TIGR00255 family)
MTGYGDAAATVDGVHYFVEVRSLNNKYFKATIRLAEPLQGLEAEFETRLRETIHRGTVTLTARCTDTSAHAAYEINRDALSRYLEQVRAVKADGVAISVDIGALLSLPGVLQPPTNEEEILARARQVFAPLLDQALTGLAAMRTREGASIARELRENLDAIALRLQTVRARAPQVVAEYQTRLKQRIDALLADASMRAEPVEIIREVAAYAERTDIAEELHRLEAHVDQFRGLIASADARPVGRTLDFLAQEMLREANTIASKSPDSDISRAVVEIKGLIDRLKEQVQNVE